MSENNKLSIDDIIRRAREINAEAQRQLQAAEESLNEKAKNELTEVVVDEAAVARRVAEALEQQEVSSAAEDEDVKTFVPSKATAPAEDAEEEIKTAMPVSAPKPEETTPFAETPTDGKTRNISLTDKPGQADNEKQPAEEADDGKTKLSPLGQGDEKTKRVAFVSSKPKPSEESELQEIPTIVARKNLYDTFGGDASVQFEEETGEQIRLEGFDDAIDTVPEIDEAVAERELERRREEKIGKFRLFGPDETDSELGDTTVVPDDYESADERETFMNRLLARKNTVKLRLLITLAPAVLLVLLTLFKDSVYFPMFLSSHTAYFGVAAVLYAVILGVNFNVLAHGFSFKRKINFDFPVALLAVAVLVHTLLLLFNSSLWIDNGMLLCAAGAFAVFMSQLGKLRMLSVIAENFRFISGNGRKYTVENIANAVDAEIISRGVTEEENPRLKTSVKTDFPTNFLEISCKYEPADRIARLVLPVILVLTAALYVTIGLLDNFNTALNVAFCALAISVPSSALFITNTMLADITSQLSTYGARVCGYDGALMATDADAMVMEAADLFGKDSCDLHGIKTFGGAKVDDAIIYAAAVIMQTKSPLAHVFDDVIIGKQNILPKVEGITYEDTMGTSAWIYKRKVLVGTRELLAHHGVKVPKASFEEKYTFKGRKALYLAVAGEIIAMFIVSYSANPDLKRELKKLEKSGISVIVKSADPYINEESLAELFGLPEGFIRVLNYSGARTYEKYSGLAVEKSPAYVVHRGTALGFVSAMRGAGILVNSRGLMTFLSVFGSLLGFAAVALLAVLEAYTQLGAIGLILFQLIWTAFMTLVVKLRGLGL